MSCIQTNLLYPYQSVETIIERDSTKRSKYGTYFFVTGETLDSLTNSSNCELRTKLKLLSKLIIAKFVDTYLSIHFMVKSYLCSLRGGSVYPPHRIKEVINLFFSR